MCSITLKKQILACPVKIATREEMLAGITKSADFITVGQYPWGIQFLPGELGCDGVKRIIFLNVYDES